VSYLPNLCRTVAVLNRRVCEGAHI
jgi:hypothetical protein